MNPYRTNYDPGDPTQPPKWYQRRVPRWVSVAVIGLCLALSAFPVVQAATPALRVNGIIFGANDKVVYAQVYGCAADGTTDDTTCLQNALNAATTSGATLMLSGASYKSGLITYTGANRVDIQGTASTVIKTTASTWLKLAPTAGTTAGVRLSSLTIQPISGSVIQTPLVWLEGKSTGGITTVDINNLIFVGGGSATTPVPFDAIWLRGVFNGRVANIYGSLMYASRGIVCDSNGINSGNLNFDSIIFADAAVGLVVSGAGGVAGAGLTSFLHNQIETNNFKMFRTATASDAAPYNEITLTAGISSGATTITVSVPDATIINANLTAVPPKPQWVVLGDVTNFDGVYQITAANTGTGVLTLATGTRYAIANGTVLGVGVYGTVLGGNARGVQINSQHCEQIGACIYTSTAQQVNIYNSYIAATNCKRGVVITNSGQNIKAFQPLFSSSGSPTVTLMEVTAQGTNTHNILAGPADINFAAPVSYLADANAVGTVDNRYLPTESTFELDALATANTSGVFIKNATASTVGTQVQNSPALELGSTSWNTTAVASQNSYWQVQSVPTSGASITGQLEFLSSLNGSAPALRAYVNSAGAIVATGALLAGSTGAGTVQAANLEPGAATTQTIGTSSNSTSITEGRAGGSYTNNSPASFTSTFSVPAIGPNSSQQHTLPAVASDTVALLAASQTLTNKTFSGGTFTGTIAGTPTLSGGFVASGSVAFQSAVRPHRITVADANYTALVSDGFIAYTTISAARVISISCTGLGSASSPQMLIVKDEAGTASGTNTITITPTTGTIDGGASVVCVNAAKGSCRIYSNGANCFTW